jgi:hypothetical protein
MSEEDKACFNYMKVPSFLVTIVFRCVRWSGEMRYVIAWKKIS